MGFYAESFVYDGLPSEFYNLRIANLGESNSSNSGNGTVEIIDEYIFRKPVPYFYGVHYNSKLSFPVSIFSPDEITAIDASYIQDWLMGQLSYKQFAVIQPDMVSFYFNSIFTDPSIVRVGNVIRGFECTCLCDSQFAWNYPATKTYNYSNPSGEAIVFHNNSHYKGYLYPQMTFTMNASGGDLSITNATDGNREFLFEGLSAYEVITVNNELGIIESSSGARRLSKFNKNFLRFLPGINTLSLTGNISQLTLTYQFMRRVSG